MTMITLAIKKFPVKCCFSWYLSSQWRGKPCR